MSGQVYYGEADLCIGQASMIMMLEALDYISYLIPTSYGKLAGIFQQPRATHDILSSVFSYQIWVAWSFVWVIIAGSLVLVNYLTNKIRPSNRSELSAFLTELCLKQEFHLYYIQMFLQTLQHNS